MVAGQVPHVSEQNLGRRITLEGWAVNRKGGAALEGDGFTVWIEGMESWPAECCVGGTRGRRLRVTGVLAEDHGLSVFIPRQDQPRQDQPRQDQPVPQGIPVPEGTDLEVASRRFLLVNACWEFLDEKSAERG